VRTDTISIEGRDETSAVTAAVTIVALDGIPLVSRGDDLCEIVLRGLDASGKKLRDGDVLVIAQKIVSKLEGRLVALDSICPSVEATRLAREVGKDARLVQLILNESREVVRKAPGVLIVEHRLGFVLANAGIDFSNVDQRGGSDQFALLLPEDPDASCRQLRRQLKEVVDADVGVIINDSHGRAFRNGTTGVAIGVSGIDAVSDLRGRYDLFRRRLQSSELGTADELASAGSLLMGQAGEGRPIVLISGLPPVKVEGSARQLARSKQTDLFRGEHLADWKSVAMGRRTIRRYRSNSVPQDVIDRMLRIAVCAPSAHNRQPWRFVVLNRLETRERVARDMGDRLRADRRRDGDPIDVVQADYERSVQRIIGAPLAILVCLTVDDMDQYPDDRRAAAEHQMAAQSTAMAMQNLLLAAHAEGLGASIMCAPLFCPDTVRRSLNLNRTWEPQALITLGYPAGEPKPFKRRPIEDVVHYPEPAEEALSADG
jgi:coenzyme F420-0:L-glutamate ligase / coenzyme F420-1:gamma-L-glutamate ligase